MTHPRCPRCSGFLAHRIWFMEGIYLSEDFCINCARIYNQREVRRYEKIKRGNFDPTPNRVNQRAGRMGGLRHTGKGRVKDYPDASRG